MPTEIPFSKPTSNLVKLTLFVQRKSSLSKEEFEKYWADEHPKALSAFNDKIGRPFVKYVQCHRNLPVPSDGQERMKGVFGGENAFDGGYEAVVEVWFESVERMYECYTHPLYKEMVTPDEGKFGQGPMKFLVQQEVKQWDYTESA